MKQKKKADLASKFSIQDDLAYNDWLENESQKEPETEDDYIDFLDKPRTVKQLRVILDLFFAGSLGSLIGCYLSFYYLGQDPGAVGIIGKILGFLLIITCIVCYRYENKASKALKNKFQEFITEKRAEAIVEEEAEEQEDDEEQEEMTDEEKALRIQEYKEDLKKTHNKKSRRFLRWLF